MTYDDADKKSQPPLTKKAILSQIFASTAQNLLLLDLGMAISVSTIVIPALLGANSSFSFTEEQASWFGSINLIMQPIGSIVSGMMIEPIGRKKSLIVANAPFSLAYLIFYFAESVELIFVGNVLLGIAVGFTEAPIMSYVGEISHPSIRGMLVSLSQFCCTTGIFLMYLLGTVLDYRNASLVCAFVPVITFFVILLIPESPVWLLTKGRHDDALKSLCWVRGWAKPEEVKSEFEELVSYQKNSHKCRHCPPELDESQCEHMNTTLKSRLKTHYDDMTRKEMLRPLLLVMFMFTCHHIVGINPIKPNMVNIYKCYGFTIDTKLATVILGLIGIICTICMIAMIKLLGKRKLALTSMMLCAFCTMMLGLYAYVLIPHEISSYTNKEVLILDYPWMPMTLFALLNIFGYFGIMTVPWIIVSEVFPLKGRGMGCAIGAAYAYIFGFVTNKTYYNLEVSFGIHGAFWFYTAGTIVGFVIMYVYFPETENKRIDEIEKHFSAEKMIIVADDRVARTVKKLLAKRNSKVGVKQINLETISSTIRL